MLHPVILCGGAGTRLWPASRPQCPKQFLPLTGSLSSFQQTLLRLQPLTQTATPLIVTGAGMADLVAEQAAQIDCAVKIVIEPEARDSGPAIAAATALVLGEDPDGVVVMLAADHHVGEIDLFVSAVEQAALIAQEGYIVTFGVKPSSPATGYGYIRAGSALVAGGFKVEAFVEKPDLATAERYVADGYLWNSGNFAFLARVLLEDMAEFEPELESGAREAAARARSDGNRVWLDQASFALATRKSLDFAVMEKTRRAAVAPALFSWSDLGAWDAILAASPVDDAGNFFQGPVASIDSHGVLVRSDGPLVGVIGLEDIAVIVENGQVLVCKMSESQKVKQVAEQAKQFGQAKAEK
jgi:mannose-1-phosphate guanylyltransferase/mannose-6-phosphate isomerase